MEELAHSSVSCLSLEYVDLQLRSFDQLDEQL
jgi:hypothetical protein